MQHDLRAVLDRCAALGVFAFMVDENEVRIPIGHELELSFWNYQPEESLVGVARKGAPHGVDWHVHGEIDFCKPDGYVKSVQPTDLIGLLHAGEVLICELWRNGEVFNRTLEHSEFNDEFRFLEPEDELHFYRARLEDLPLKVEAESRQVDA
jgi:hypothetical protein